MMAANWANATQRQAVPPFTSAPTSDTLGFVSSLATRQGRAYIASLSPRPFRGGGVPGTMIKRDQGWPVVPDVEEQGAGDVVGATGYAESHPQ